MSATARRDSREVVYVPEKGIVRFVDGDGRAVVAYLGVELARRIARAMGVPFRIEEAKP
jgi:hypothetical protein